MALLIFQANRDQPELRLLRSRYVFLVIVSMTIMWGTTWIGTLYPRFDMQSLITETTVYSWSVLMWFWFIWGNQSWPLRIKALLHATLWAITSAGVIWLTKWGLAIHFLNAGVADQASLYWGLLYCIPPLLFFWQVARQPRLQMYGVHFRQLRLQLVAGGLLGLLLSLHMITTVHFSGVTSLSIKPLPYLVWTLGYEVFQSLAEEVFFRGIIFRGLQSIFQLNFWQASVLTIGLNLSIFMLKTGWRSPLESSALLIYLSLLALANCFLYRRFQSILPGTVTNVLFSIASTLRG